MAATKQLPRSGAVLFRYRSYFPPLLMVVLVLGLIAGRDTRTEPGLDRRLLGIGLVTVALGLGVRAFVIGTVPRGTSGRSTLEQVAEELNTSGLYSVVRHPIYLGNLVIWLGLAAATAVWWAPLVVALAFAGFYRRIIVTEEEFLAREFGEPFTAWAAVTPAVLPNVRRWRPPSLPFSIKIVLRQEYYGLFTVVLFLVLLELAAHVIDEGIWRVGRGWLWLLAATTVTTGVLRLLQRYTSVLDVEGR